MRAPVGAIVGLYVDLVAEVAIGDAIQTGTGRTYHVIGVRRQLRGKAAGRQHLSAIVMEAPPPDARVHTIRWYKREAKRRR